jgi:hypothetical protein
MEVALAISRRSIIQAAGGAGLALVGVGGLYTATRTPARALAAWTAIGNAPPNDVRLDAFRHAILAPNPHNRQPWRIQLVGDDEAIITCDLDRRLPETDPFDRQIVIGFGCFLEIARIAAAERGVAMEIKPFPDGAQTHRLDLRTIARLRFVKTAAGVNDPLFSAISNRHTVKKPYDIGRPVEQRVLDSLSAHKSPRVQVFTTSDDDLVRKLRAQTWEAWLVELQTSRTWMETVNLMRIGKTEIEANPDGVSMGGALMDALALTGQISRQQIGTPGSAAYKTSIERYRPIMSTGMAYAWIETEGNSRTDQLAAGQVYVRMHLEATRQGLGFHPVSQALQEFPEMKAAFDEIHVQLGARPGRRVQMLVRLGYGASGGRTPRWPLERKLVPG